VIRKTQSRLEATVRWTLSELFLLMIIFFSLHEIRYKISLNTMPYYRRRATILEDNFCDKATKAI